MATSSLWVHLKEAKVVEQGTGHHVEVQVCLRLGSHSPFISPRAFTPNPTWDEDISFSVSDAEMVESLLVELTKPKFLFRSELLGRTSVPLISVRHSNKPSSGYWFSLFLPSPDGSKDVPTQHQICLDTHFELPKDLPPEVVETLEQKLELFNSVLDKEMELIESQEHRLVTGSLAPPPKDANHTDGNYSITSSLPDITVEPEPEHFSSRTALIMMDGRMDSAHSSRRQSMASTRNDSLDVDDTLYFDGFDWTRASLSPEHRPTKRVSQPNISRHDRSGSVVESSGFSRSLEHRKGFRKEKSLDILDSRRSSSPRHGAKGRLSRSRNSSIGSYGSLRSRESPTPSPAFVVSEAARVRWQQAIKSVGETNRKNSPGPKGFGNITIIQLVDQLKSYKIKSKELSEQNVETFSTANSKFRIRSRSVLDGKRRMLLRKHHMDEQVRLNVYKKALEALLYPASEPDSHAFGTWSARKPTMCSECNYLLWGLTRQGVKCSRCGKICHERCSTLCSQNCYIHDQYSAVRDKMQRMLVNHSNRFELLQQAFSMTAEQHTHLREEMEGSILRMLNDYKADISITVIAVQGIVVPKNSHYRLYVSVAVGDERMKTDVFKKKMEDKVPPSWNQEFTFTCFSYSDLIQLRVWNERDNAVARVANKLTKEGDLFLGEKIVEVQKVGMSQDVWYKLEKRTEKGPEVSGHIKVNISVTVEGERVASFYHYYTKLHEQLFVYCHIHNDNDLVIVPAKQLNQEEQLLAGQKTLQLLPKGAQEVVDEFSLRYGIESIYRMMLHIELLVNHHSMKHALQVINNMLKSLKYQMFIHVAADHAARGVGATVLMEEYMDASNFGRDKFFQVLDKLLNALKLDLQQYREFYPHKDDQKLLELLETFELMGTVIEFQQQAMGIFTSNKVSELILDNMKECLKNTFDFIVQSSVSGNNDEDKHPALDKARTPFEFFYQILSQLKGVILEDRTVYGEIMAKYCNVKFGDVSAVELWHLFSSIVEGLFEPDENLAIFTPNDYITLLFTIKTFYDTEIRPIVSRQDKVPEFPRWFVRCVQKWLHQFQENGTFFVNNAWDDDKNGLKFAPHENQKLSSSAFQMFFYLHQGLEFTQSLESGDVEVKHMHIKEFSMVIINVVQHYVDKVALAIPEYMDDLETMCMLLNNLHALRTNIHRLFDEMGGTESAGEGASRVLTEFQQQLSKQLSHWCTQVARNLNSEITAVIKKVQTSLIKLKGQGNVERNDVKTILEPFLDLLSSKLRLIVNSSEPAVQQKCIKEVWYTCLENLHHMLLPMLKWEHGETHSAPTPSSSFFSYSAAFPLHNYTTRQCSALEVMIEMFKEFFVVAEEQGVKRSTIERGIKQLKAVITLYRETTEMLISDFIVDETRNGLQTTDASCGEVHLEIDAYSHPSTGELDGSIRVISAADLKPLSGSVAIKPAIELNLIAPTLSSNQRKFITTAKGSINPNFNQNFKFTLASNWENSELLVLAKHKARFGKDGVIGMAIVPFSSIKEQASLTLGLAASSSLSDRGRAILNVLTVRSDDNFAKEFVTLKTSQRSSGDSEN